MIPEFKAKTIIDVTYKEFADYLNDTAAFLDEQYPKDKCLSQEDIAVYEAIRSWREKCNTVVDDSLITPVKLLIKIGNNKLIIDVSRYSSLREAKESIKVKINNSLKDDILNDTMLLMDFKGSTCVACYNPKDTSNIVSKIEDNLHKLLTKYF